MDPTVTTAPPVWLPTWRTLRGEERWNDAFELMATAFQEDTGYLAPGKDQPPGAADPQEERERVFSEWFEDNVAKWLR